MNIESYVIAKMAQVGAGVEDARNAKSLCDLMTRQERDVLDCWHNLGPNAELTIDAQAVANSLRQEYEQDDLTVLAAYVNAKRNLTEY